MSPNWTLSDQPNYPIALIMLLVFGFAYNFLVAWLEKRGWERGVTSLLVVAGTAVTLLPVAWLANWQLFADLVGLFAASGVSMVVGSLHRYLKERDDEKAELVKAARGPEDGL